MLRQWVGSAALSLVLGCSAQPATALDLGGGPVFTIQVGSETFKVQTSTSTATTAMRARLQSQKAGVIIGTLASGDGGVNAPYGWHLDPSTVVPADVATEVCDGRPSDVQNNLAYWLTVVRSYCPWSARVVGEGR